MAETKAIPDYPRGITFEQVWEALMKTDEQMKQTDRQMKKLNKQMGELNNRFGEMAEHLVAPGISKRFNELGYHFNDVSPGGRKILDKNGKIKTEIDIILENGDCIMAVEVKTKPRIKDIEHHVKCLEILKEHRSLIGDNRKIYGAIAGAVFGNEEKQLAAESGFYVLEQSGDTMKIDIPDNFIPRQW